MNTSLKIQMKLGIEFCRFSKEHKGGKCQVAYNLLKGFYENGYTESIVCFCHEELKDILLQIAPSIDVVIVPNIMGEKRNGIVPNRIKEGRYLGKLVKEQKIDLMLFTNKFAPIVKTNCKSVLIAHDILVFIAAKNKDIVYHKKVFFTDKISLYIDFILHDYIVAISEFDKNSMIKYISKSKKIKRIYNPIVFPNYQKDQEKKYITALNIQHLHKNIMTLIEAFNIVKDRTDYNLIIVGKAPRNIQEIKEYIEYNNLNDRVIMTGFVTEDELESIISKTRLYVNPSLFEGFGMTSVEMMGNEIPVICADNSAQKEVTCGKAKYYSPAKDAQALAEVIQEELNHPTDQKRLSECANMVREKYDYKVIAREYWELFNSILEGETIWK